MMGGVVRWTILLALLRIRVIPTISIKNKKRFPISLPCCFFVPLRCFFVPLQIEFGLACSGKINFDVDGTRNVDEGFVPSPEQYIYLP
ncbi:hypothetical protein [Pasteuria penetrans]|uniref:hypothetical protein n=1 Tax=Pasteuria penetrans TaxID=86005 RepID=UPI00165C7EFD|nr:hypothetical protein [Pasteuria penetrans]